MVAYGMQHQPYRRWAFFLFNFPCRHLCGLGQPVSNQTDSNIWEQVMRSYGAHLADEQGKSAIFSFTLAWNEFLLALVITMDQSTMTVPIKLSMMVVGDQYVWGQLMAGAVLASIPVGILYFIGQRFVVQGL